MVHPLSLIADAECANLISVFGGRMLCVDFDQAKGEQGPFIIQRAVPQAVFRYLIGIDLNQCPTGRSS
jgi:hypothetical protein